VLPAQLTLLGGSGPPDFDRGFSRLARRELSRGPKEIVAWVDYVPGWVSGHETLFEHLLATTTWHEETRQMYDSVVAVPRLWAGLPKDGPGHPLLDAMRDALSARYGEAFVRTGMGLYRSGADSVAWHGDYVARELPEALVATVSLGAPRRFLLREAAGGASISYSLGWGDLIVMGGSCQRTWRHCIPKVAQAEPRLAIMFRPLWQTPPGFRGRTGY
jgi:alkylated DNA repair dioxygenase AlkB